MAKKFFRKKIILAAPAGTVLAGANAMVATNIDITPLVAETVDRGIERPHFGASPEIKVGEHAQISFTVELNDQDSDLNAGGPPWAVLLKACGYAATYAAAQNNNPETLAFNPITGAEPKIDIAYNLDGILHTIAGALGTVEFTLPVRGLATMRFTFTGAFAPPVDTPAVAGVYTAWDNPVVVSRGNTPTFEVDAGDSVILASLAIVQGNEIVFRELVNDEDADVGALITGRAITGTLVMDTPAASTFNPIAKAALNETIAINLVHQPAGSGQRQIDLAIRAAEIGAGVTYQDDNGVLQYAVPFRALPSDSGNDEFILSLTEAA